MCVVHYDSARKEARYAMDGELDWFGFVGKVETPLLETQHKKTLRSTVNALPFEFLALGFL